LTEATPEELGEMMELTRRLEGILLDVYHPDGVNVGMNLGKPAGAGVAGHIHLHVVPRWVGDTNFMTVVGGTRVIPEDPVAACARLRPYFSR
jgi:ATP adenylyltransferase